MNDSYRYERLVVELFVEIIESRGLSHDPLAVEAWPWRKAAGRTWQDMRNKQDTPQRLTMRDAHGMARALGMSMSAICAIIEGRMIDSQIKHNAIAIQKNAGTEQHNISKWTKSNFIDGATDDN